MPKQLAAIIFGGGLAGTILAERFLASGLKILLVDNPNKSSCSRVAAGLINPIGGKRLKRVWLADTLIPHALAYYRNLEEKHGQPLYHPRPIHRYFSNEQEAQLWQKRLQDPAYANSTTPLPNVGACLSRDSLGFAIPNVGACLSRDSLGFAIPNAGYLDTNALLGLLHNQLAAQDNLLSSTFNYDEIQLTKNGVTFRDHQALLAIFAEGHLATGNPHFQFVPYKPAKGIIATIKLQTPRTQHPEPKDPIILKGKFIVPRHDGTIQVGATYNWNDPTDTPDQEGIQELEQFLNDTLGPNTWKFDQIRAGVRPATAGAYPIVGPHPQHPQLIAFNGFGSKGSLQIPYFADALLQSIQAASPLHPSTLNLHPSTFPQPLPPEVLPARFLKKGETKPKRWIATNVAKNAVLEILKPGDLAIDATAGNGHDTQWLAETVGPTGHVFAYDIQEQALETTRQRLQKKGLYPHTTLIHSGHESLLETIPPQHHGKIAAIVFNLGFLPGGNAELITQAETTSRALKTSLELLKPGGILSVTLYPTHPGAQEEVALVLSWFHQLPEAEYQTHIEPHPQGNPSSPYPIFIRKR